MPGPGTASPWRVWAEPASRLLGFVKMGIAARRRQRSTAAVLDDIGRKKREGLPVSFFFRPVTTIVVCTVPQGGFLSNTAPLFSAPIVIKRMLKGGGLAG